VAALTIDQSDGMHLDELRVTPLQNVPVGWRQLLAPPGSTVAASPDPARRCGTHVRAGQLRAAADHGDRFCERRVNSENSGCESGIADLVAVTLVTWR
jgi:hypothetical protein